MNSNNKAIFELFLRATREMIECAEEEYFTTEYERNEELEKYRLYYKLTKQKEWVYENILIGDYFN